MMQSSGTAGISTTDDTAVTLIANTNGETAYQVTVTNSGAAPGFFSIDGGVTWFYIMATSVRTLNLNRVIRSVVVQAKRVPGGTNMTGLFADAI